MWCGSWSSPQVRRTRFRGILASPGSATGCPMCLSYVCGDFICIGMEGRLLDGPPRMPLSKENNYLV